jgi:hypothetical protein
LPDPKGEFAGQPENFATVRQALAGLPAAVDPDDIELPDGIFDFDGGLPGSFKTSQLHVTRHLQPISVERFAAIPEGGNRLDLPWKLQTPGWRKHRTGSMDVMGRLRWDKPSVTIRTEFVKPEKGRYLHPVEHRPPHPRRGRPPSDLPARLPVVRRQGLHRAPDRQRRAGPAGDRPREAHRSDKNVASVHYSEVDQDAPIRPRGSSSPQKRLAGVAARAAREVSIERGGGATPPTTASAVSRVLTFRHPRAPAR